MLLANLARLGSGVVAFVLLARVWGPHTFGVFMYAFTVATLLSMIVDYGFGLQLVRDIGRNARGVNELVHRALGAKLSLTVAAIALLGAIGPLIGGEVGTLPLVWMLFIAAVFNSFGLFFNLPLRGLNQFAREARIAVAANGVLVAGVAVLAGFHATPLAIASAFVATRFLYLWVSLGAYRNLVGKVRWTEWNARSSLISIGSGFPFGVHVALGTIYFQLDTIVVQHVLGPNAVGQYQAGVRLMMAGLVVADAVTSAYLPAVAAAWPDGPTLPTLAKRLNFTLLAVGGLGFASLAALGGFVVHVVYGVGFRDLAPLLPMFGVVLFLRYAGAGYGVLLTVADRQVVRMYTVLGAAVVSLWLNVALIPRFGLPGAVYASIFTHILLNAVYTTFAVREMKSWCLAPESWWMLAFVSGACLALWAGVSPVIVGVTSGTLVVVVALCAAGRYGSLFRSLLPVLGRVD